MSDVLSAAEAARLVGEKTAVLVQSQKRLGPEFMVTKGDPAKIARQTTYQGLGRLDEAIPNLV